MYLQDLEHASCRHSFGDELPINEQANDEGIKLKMTNCWWEKSYTQFYNQAISNHLIRQSPDLPIRQVIFLLVLTHTDELSDAGVACTLVGKSCSTMSLNSNMERHTSKTKGMKGLVQPNYRSCKSCLYLKFESWNFDNTVGLFGSSFALFTGWLITLCHMGVPPVLIHFQVGDLSTEAANQQAHRWVQILSANSTFQQI